MGPIQYHGYVKGSSGLAEFTGIKDHRVHEKWRLLGLPYTMIGRTFLYKKRDVEKFLDRQYGVRTIKLPEFARSGLEKSAARYAKDVRERYAEYVSGK